MGGVVLNTTPTVAPCAELRNDSVLDDQIGILDALHMIHLRPFQLPDFSRQDSRQCAYIINDCLHVVLSMLLTSSIAFYVKIVLFVEKNNKYKNVSGKVNFWAKFVAGKFGLWGGGLAIFAEIT